MAIQKAKGRSAGTFPENKLENSPSELEMLYTPLFFRHTPSAKALYFPAPASTMKTKTSWHSSANDEETAALPTGNHPRLKRYNHKNIFTIPFSNGGDLEAAIAKMNPSKAPMADVILAACSNLL
ncbi:hypothetical protein TNCV_3044501 [Trichonephila clavipes]|nr:hypothetical protein TNCV_3044501 [Trichonephila clavipes]